LMLDRTGAARVRKHRARRSRGRKVYRIEQDEVAIEAMLEAEGLVPVDQEVGGSSPPSCTM
jgi:hypothetical protein